MSYGKISKELGVAKSTLLNWNTEFKEDILVQLRDYKNELRDEYQISEIRRMEFFCERLKSVQGEIEKKGLSDLKINQLLGLEVRYLKYLEDL